jgi:FMN phosphatase YigB (HAD superfamily)
MRAYDEANSRAHFPFASHTFGEVSFFRDAFSAVGAADDVDPEEALAEYRRIVLEETRLEPEIRRALGFLGEAGILRAILSNERAARVEGFLSATASRELFEVVFVSERYGVEKPDRAFFDAALSEIGVAPQEALMFGDNTIADGACTEAGMPFVYVEAFATTRWYFERGGAHEPDYTISEITEASLRACLAHFG